MVLLERARGIEPPYHAWQARILTIILRPQHNYDNKIDSSCQLFFWNFMMVGKTGFEPATSWSQTRRSTKLSYFP